MDVILTVLLFGLGLCVTVTALWAVGGLVMEWWLDSHGSHDYWDDDEST